MNLVAKTVTKIIFPFIVLFGVYLAFYGHLNPGGAFTAGVVVITAFVALLITEGEEGVRKVFPEIKMISTIAFSCFMILLIIIFEFFVFARWSLLHIQTPMTLWSGGFTLFLNLAGMLVIAAALIMIIYSLIEEEWKIK